MVYTYMYFVILQNIYSVIVILTTTKWYEEDSFDQN